MTQDTSHNIIRQRGITPRLLRYTFILLLMFLGANEALAQTTDYTGIYYIASGNTAGKNNVADIKYNSETPANNYYLCPTDETSWICYVSPDDYTNPAYDNDQPFLTTYKYRATQDPSPAIWIIKKVPETEYYHIIHYNTSRYLTYNGPIRYTSGSGTNRIRFHLQSTPTDSSLFQFNPDADLQNTVYRSDSAVNIVAVAAVGVYYYNNNNCKYLNLSSADNNSLVGTSGKTDGPTGYKNVGSTIGIWNDPGRSSEWFLEDGRFLAPTISAVDPDDNTISVTDNNNFPAGYNIRYTISTNGSAPDDPTATSPIMTNGVYLVSEACIIKAVIERDGIVLTKVATSGTLEPTTVDDPTFEVNCDNKLEIHATIPSAHIYYTKANGTAPADPSNGQGSTRYTAPITLNAGDIVKAIAYNQTETLNSGVSTYTYSDADMYSETPTISFSGTTITISYNGSATIYYTKTEDGTEPGIPTAESQNGSSPLAITIDPTKETRIRAKAKAGNFKISCEDAEYIIPAPPTITISSDGDDVASPHVNKLTITGGEGVTFWYTITSGSVTDAPDPATTTYTQWTSDSYIDLDSYVASNQATCRVFAYATNNSGDRSAIVGSESHSMKTSGKPTLTPPAGSDPTLVISNGEVGDNVIIDNGTPADATDDVILPVTFGGTAEYSIPYEATGTLTVSFKHGDWLQSYSSTYTIPGAPATPTYSQDVYNHLSLSCATEMAIIHYTIDDTEPTLQSPTYTAGCLDNIATGTTVRAKSFYGFRASAEMKDVNNSAIYYVYQHDYSDPPQFHVEGNNVVISVPGHIGATIYYTYNTSNNNTDVPSAPNDATTSDNVYGIGAPLYDNQQGNIVLPGITIFSAIAEYDGLLPSYPVQVLTREGYSINGADELYKLNTYNSSYIFILSDIDNAGSFSTVPTFTGVIEGNSHTITGLTQPLIGTADGAVIHDLYLDDVSINITTANTNVGAIAQNATGSARIYNCGILNTGSTELTNSSTISGTQYVGGIVGYIDGNARIINCFSYADINGGTHRGGIVGYNNVATTSNTVATGTMVMNCMFYGDISTTGSPTQIAPIYGGEIITNAYTNANSTGLNNYNYFRFNKPYVSSITTFNCALGAQDRYLERFEFYRMTLNSTRDLAAWYVSGDPKATSLIAKWVLDKKIAPYPILKDPGYYPSIFNPDAKNATPIDANNEHRNEGRKLGTLTVNIQLGSGGAQFNNASASLKAGKSTLTLNITDKDYDNHNFNYKKVQLPYYNEVGEGNYTNYRVVTGWKIVGINGSNSGTGGYSTGVDVAFDGNGEITSTPYNFVDRASTNKDLYSVSGRVFNQGAYWEVPDGVTSITIEPYWAKAAYLSDPTYDITYQADKLTEQEVSAIGHNRPTTLAPGDQAINTVFANALSELNASDADDTHTVYDYAIVLVGNYHKSFGETSLTGNNIKPVTIMSADFDHDCEPDYTFFYQHTQRVVVAPLRFDFISIPGIGMMQKATGSNYNPEPGIFRPKHWFEITNTVLIHFNQFEYADNEANRVSSPLILQGGIYEQFISTRTKEAKNTQYLLIGSNAWFKTFANGCHTSTSLNTPKVPISVAGGDYEKFYLSGIYRPQWQGNTDNAECYIDGGRFGEVAGAGMELIGKVGNNTGGNVTWIINAADIDEFYGGGINDAKPVQGNIYTEISNSYVRQFCGGPKFGNMNENKTVTTKATNCYFGDFYGAGYGGTSIFQLAYEDISTQKDSPDVSTERWNAWATGTGPDNAHYIRDYETTHHSNVGNGSNETPNAISVGYDYEYFYFSGGANTKNFKVARFYVNYATLSLATTQNVYSTLTGCKLIKDWADPSDPSNINKYSKGNLFGGGDRGFVTHDVETTISNCTVDGNVYGAGYQAEAPTVDVMRTTGFQVAPFYNNDAGMFNDEQVKTALTDSYTWTSANSVSSGNAFDDTNHLIYTTVELDHLGTVGGNATLTIKGNTRVAGNVFGGGDLSSVGTSTTVAIQDQTSISGDLFGGGNEADVMGNTSVTMSAGNVLGSVYGGGNYGSVGTYYYESAQYDESKPGENNGAAGKPLTCKNNTGTSTVIIEGSSEVGPLQPMSMKASGGPDDKGHVFGASKGMIDDISGGDKNYVLYMAYVNNTSVTVRGNALVRGSVYGGSENGHVLHDTYVYIQGGQIGCGDGLGTRYSDNKFVDPTVTPVTTINALGECASWDYEAPYSPYDPFAKYQNPGDNKYYYDNGYTYYAENGASTATDGHTYYGNVFGGGSGSIPYWDATNHQSVYLSSSGFVEGDTHVIISGGHILTNVYGGCEATNVLGTTNVTMTGGTVGVPRTEQQIKAHPLTGYLFGGGKGDQRIFFNKETNVNDANVSVSGGIIYSSVFGGGEDGHVLRNATVTISGNTIIGTAGTTYVDGNVFGAGRGFGGDALTAGNVGGSVELNIQGGTMLGSVYGGGRLASVGYGLYLSTGAETANYGVMRADNEYNDPGFNFTSSFFNEKGRGHITINISGGTIGKQFNSDVDGAEHSGNVFGGSMGRLTKLDNTTINTLWPKLATVKSTTVNISQTSNSNPTIIRRSVYGGGELGTVTTNSAVTVSGGTIQGSIFGGGYGSDDDSKSFTESATTYSPIELAGKINGNTVVNLTGGTVTSDVYGGGALASVGGNTTVNLFGGAIYGDAYGGGLGQIGRAADVSNNIDAITPVAAIVGGNVTVNLDDPTEAEDVDATATAFTTNPAEGGVNHTHTTSATIDQTTYTGIQTAGRIFGCNNQNGTPKGTVTINVYRTYHGQNDKPGKTAFDQGEGTYEVAAVYGGGNLATYDPTNPENKTQVNIYGCGLTSIKYVYGGGNAAPVPASEVNVEGTYEIYRVFGGGNGKDPINKYGGANNWELNPGADVGIKPYTGSNWNNESQETKALLYADLNGDKGTNTETGQNIYIKYADNSDENSIIGTTKVTVLGGTIHDVFGGSNTKGDIVKKTNVKVGDELLSTCPLNVGGVYGGSNEAYISGETDLDLSCTEGTQEIFGGSHDADVEQNVHLKINSGHYERVFGGNNNSGSIKGSITVTIEENGCLPIEIDELYGGGYLAAYSIYGYDNNGIYRTSAPDGFTPYADPQINVISATRIGKIFGGGYGEGAVMVGNPHVNINMENGTIDGRYRYNQQKSDPRYNSGDANYSYTELDGTTPLVLSAQGEGGFESPKQIPLGTIGDIFGGGNDAQVIGNTYVEIGTGQWLNPERKLEIKDNAHTYTYNETTEKWEYVVMEDGEGDEKVPVTYSVNDKPTPARNAAQITGAVYGGGNNADVTNTNVEIANGQIEKNVYGGGFLGDVGIIDKTDIRQYTWTNNTGICYVNITGGTIGPDNVNDLSIDKGNVFGGGEGIANTFWCEKGMAYSTTVNISNGTVKRNVYGGGKIARVESNTAVTIGTANETGNSYAPIIKGNVFGAGAGTDTHGYSALVRGNSTVTIQGIAKVEQNVYGGGEEASTGKYQLVTEENKDQHPGLEVGMPYSLVNDGLGITTVTIQDNATILGNVFGAGKGHEPNYTASGNNRSKRMMTYDSQLYPNNTEGTSWDYYEDPTYVWEYFTTLPKYLTFIETLGLVTQTNVTIGENASVNESVYGGSENGFVQHNTNVTIQGNTSIGNDIFGGGLGLATFTEAGRVNGNTNVTITGGFIKHNVYGGGELGSVGTVIEKTPHNTEGPATDNSLYNFEISWPVEFKYKENTGKTTVIIREANGSKIRLGTNGDDNGDVFGGGKGDVTVDWVALKANTTRWESFGDNDDARTINYLARYRSVDEADFANVKETDVTVDLPFTGNINSIVQPLYVKDNDGGSKWKLIIDATSYDGTGDNDTYTFANTVSCISGSVYGGAENGHVNGDTKLTLVDGIVGHGLYGGGKGKGQYQGWLYDAKIAGSPTVKDYSAFNTAIGGEDPYYKTVDGLLGEQIYSITAGKVYGNTKVIMNDGYVLRNIFGGGNLGSVGKGNYAGGADDYSHSGYGERPDVDDSNDQQANLWTVSNGFSPTSAITSSNTPTTLADHFMSSGKTDILIKGGQVGYILPSNTTLSDQNSDNVLNRTKAAKLASKDDLPTGNVFGGCRGQASTTNAQSPRYLYIPDYFLGFVNETNIQIGDGTGTGPTILGSVYGGGQDGHVRRSTKVTVNNAYIGIPYENTNNGTYTTILGNDLSNAQWKNRGNVFGAGSGIGTFNKTDQNGVPLDDPDSNDPEDYLVDYNFASGSVTCNTDITIGNGAVIYQNVYGGGSLASIGPPKIPPLVDDEQKEATGNNPSHLSTSYTKVTIDGGTVGDNGSYAAGYGGDVYGGSRGNYDGQLNLGDAASSYATTIWTEVWAKNGTIKGNVFGGGQSGAVKQATKVTIGNNTIVTPAPLRTEPAGTVDAGTNAATQSEQQRTVSPAPASNAATESTGARTISTNRANQ